MPMTKRCGFCAHYKREEGMFGYCTDGRRKEYDDTTFSTNGCDYFVHKSAEEVQLESACPVDFGTRRSFVDPRLLEFMGMALPPGYMDQQECSCGCQEPKLEPETKWVNPVVRRIKPKHKPRKVINLADAIAERKRAI